jgi:hypothetical protein
MKQQCIDGEWYRGPYRLECRNGPVLAGDFLSYDALSPIQRAHYRRMMESQTAKVQKDALMMAMSKPRRKK